ncbi:MAG: hypothetical protein ACQR33_03260 [Candidatus Saccharibacteria bacterium]
MVLIKISFERDKSKNKHQADDSSPAQPNINVAQYKRRQHTLRNVYTASAALLVIAAGTLLIIEHGKTSTTANPIPPTLTSDLTFNLYYPASLPTDYSYKENSANISNGMLFFTLKNATGQITTVSEQAEPTEQLALSSLVGFNPLQTPIGKGVVGSQGSSTSALVETPQTLITLSGDQGTPTSTLSQIAEKLVKVK